MESGTEKSVANADIAGATWRNNIFCVSVCDDGRRGRIFTNRNNRNSGGERKTCGA